MDYQTSSITRVIAEIDGLLAKGTQFIGNLDPAELERKPAPARWSKKEILGHLIDSGINNLRRFTEIQFSEKPYRVAKYDQDALVAANHYQIADIRELLQLWFALNQRIIAVVRQQSPESLKIPVVVYGSEERTLEYLIKDYVAHMDHHLRQIMEDTDEAI